MARTAEQQRDYLNSHPEQREKARAYGRRNSWKYSGYSEVAAVAKQARGKSLRVNALLHLGEVCARCGFSDMRALQIDHIKGGGTKHRRTVSWSVFYRQVQTSQGEYQILCANCNWIKRAEAKEATGRPRV